MQLRLVAFAVGMFLACSRDGGPTATPEEIAQGCQEGVAARARADMNTCACEVEAGTYADEASCLMVVGVKYEAGCYCDRIAADVANASAAACTADAAAALAECVEKLPCSNTGARQACEFEYLQALGGCDSTTKQSAAMVQIECLGADATVCGSGESIPSLWVCDGEGDCKDRSDEAECEFTCGSGETVPIGYKCDAEPDCVDASDEDGCMWLCGSGEPIPLPERCDGTPDCMDMSDEAECDAV